MLRVSIPSGGAVRPAKPSESTAERTPPSSVRPHHRILGFGLFVISGPTFRCHLRSDHLISSPPKNAQSHRVSDGRKNESATNPQIPKRGGKPKAQDT
mmetsp:Transcript_15465/g.31637  ORF Transcript_15465/g.31637 Transcript_15465/m.31637 type:complete len:98 (+) Transcript_15465:466-759(+)